jgi:hypothetical protein
MLRHLWREDALWQAIFDAEGRQGRVLCGGADVLALVYLDPVNPVLGVATTEAAMVIPTPLDTMTKAFPITLFNIHRFLVFVDPPLMSMALSVLNVSRLTDNHAYFIVFLTPNVPTCPMNHRVAAKERAIFVPLTNGAVLFPILTMLKGLELTIVMITVNPIKPAGFADDSFVSKRPVAIKTLYANYNFSNSIFDCSRRFVAPSR